MWSSKLLISILILTPPGANALDPCSPVDIQRMLEQERTVISGLSCNRVELLNGFMDALHHATESAELAEAFLSLGSEEAVFETSMTSTAVTLDSLRDKGANHSDSPALITQAQQHASQFVTIMTDNVSPNADEAGKTVVCQAKINWRKSKEWKRALDSCPPAPASAEEEATASEQSG